jgi:hypothetical protein
VNHGNQPTNQPVLIPISVRLYAALLVLYPKPYRECYGSEMIHLFRDATRDSYRQQGNIGLLSWWLSTVLDLIVTVIEQRKEGNSMISKPIAVQPVKGSGLGLMCIVGGLIYGIGGLWLLLSGVPTDVLGIQLTHVLRLMWAGCVVCGLMGMAVTDGIEPNPILQIAAWFSGIGFVLVEIDALIALISRDPISVYTTSSLPFSNLWQMLPFIGWAILAISTLYSTRWVGWSKFAPLGVLITSLLGLLIGNLPTIKYFPVVLMGIALSILGLAIKSRLDEKRRANTLNPHLAPESIRT